MSGRGSSRFRSRAARAVVAAIVVVLTAAVSVVVNLVTASPSVTLVVAVVVLTVGLASLAAWERWTEGSTGDERADVDTAIHQKADTMDGSMSAYETTERPQGLRIDIDQQIRGVGPGGSVTGYRQTKSSG